MSRLLSAPVEVAESAEGSTVYRRIGNGPPVLLLHGYPKTHRCWLHVAPALAENRTVITPDLPGYGDSRWPLGNDEGYSKRAMADAMVKLMADLGHDRFDVVGHDRGARVSYRMALDYPDLVRSLTVIDIIPTVDEWELICGLTSIDTFHWPFLAQPGSVTEPLLTAAPDRWLDHLLDGWSVRSGQLSEESRAEYRRCFRRPGVIAGTCADYRAGAGADVDHDRRDRSGGKLIECEVLVLASAGRGDLGPHWERWARSVRSDVLDGGHFLPEEIPLRSWPGSSRSFSDRTDAARRTDPTSDGPGRRRQVGGGPQALSRRWRRRWTP